MIKSLPAVASVEPNQHHLPTGSYSPAQQAGETGYTLWDVAVHHGHFVTEVRHRLSTAVLGHKEEFARARVVSQVNLASLVMATGDPGAMPLS